MADLTVDEEEFNTLKKFKEENEGKIGEMSDKIKKLEDDIKKAQSENAKHGDDAPDNTVDAFDDFCYKHFDKKEK